jgi:hypothetical protein
LKETLGFGIDLHITSHRRAIAYGLRNQWPVPGLFGKREGTQVQGVRVEVTFEFVKNHGQVVQHNEVAGALLGLTRRICQ